MPAMANRTLNIAGAQLDVRNAAGVEYVPLSQLMEAFGGRSWRVNSRFVAVLPGDSLTPEAEYVFWADSTIVRGAEREVGMPFAPILDDDQLWVPVLALADIFPDLTTAVPLLRLLDVGESGDTLLVRFGTASAEPVTWHGEVRSTLEYRLVLGAQCDTVTREQMALIPIVVRVWPRPERKIQRLVLDPGHGGKDPGAVGRLGTLEKEVVLDVSKLVKTKLESHGFEVLMTRARDEHVPLVRRSQFALEQKADLFISIHANASPNRAACGMETYFLSEAKTDWERAVAARENAALHLDTPDSIPLGDELELILTDLAQNEYLTESSELAARIQERTWPCARIKDRGVRQANFYVLRQNYMPAVLVECGFLSNASEEKLLRSPKHRERIAEGVCAGIVEFVKEYEQRINGS
jgi:N-acetylmuramoyl-L-alanine amidase